MSMINDFQKVTAVELKKQFSFMPDNMCRTPQEFTEALTLYAEAEHLSLFIKKESLCPVFELNGIEYTASRVFGRHGAVVHCKALHPELLEEADVEPKRRTKIEIFIRCSGALAFLLYALLVIGLRGGLTPFAILAIPVSVFILYTTFKPCLGRKYWKRRDSADQ